MNLRRVLLSLVVLTFVAACDKTTGGPPAVEPPDDTVSISAVSTLTPSAGGLLTVAGANFSGAGSVSIGGAEVPAAEIQSWGQAQIVLRVPAGTPNGLLSVTNDEDATATYATPLHVVAALKVQPLAAEPGSRRYPVTARAEDAAGQPVPGARLSFEVDGMDVSTVTAVTDALGVARATLDLTGVHTAVEVRVSADEPVSVAADFAPAVDTPLGREVLVSDGTTTMPLYVQLGDAGQFVTISSLNRRPDDPVVSSVGGGAVPTAGPRDGERDEIIVAYEAGVVMSSAVRADALAAAGVQRIRSAAGPGYDLDLVRVPAGRSMAEAIATLEADPRVRYAEPNRRVYRAALPTDPGLEQQWGPFAIGAPNAWTVTDGTGAVVAVLDDAFDLRHADLVDAWLPGFDFCQNDGCSIVDADPHGDDAVHGTHVAGIIAAGHNGAGTVGIAPGAGVVPVKIMAEGAVGSTIWELISAIRWAAGQEVPGAPVNAHPADVISISFGGYYEDLSVTEAVNDAVALGAVVVAAIGNYDPEFDDSPMDVNYPGALPNVIGVGAIDTDFSRAGFSMYGPGLDIMAPGVDVLSSRAGGGSVSSSGTSMATPHVAAVAALLLAQEPELTPAEVKQRLMETAYFPEGGTPLEMGAGVVRADGVLGLPAPTSADRYVTLDLAAPNVTGSLDFDMRDGAGVTRLDEASDYLEIRFTHAEREFVGYYLGW